MHDKAIEAAREAVKAVRIGGQRVKFSDEYADALARAAILAFLGAVHQDTDPEETARYCMLAQLRRELE